MRAKFVTGFRFHIDSGMKLQPPDGTLALYRKGPIGGAPNQFRKSPHESPPIYFASRAELQTIPLGSTPLSVSRFKSRIGSKKGHGEGITQEGRGGDSRTQQ